MTSLWRRAVTDYSESPKLVTSKQNSNQQADAQLLSRWWDTYRKQLAWKTSLRKVRTLWHCSRLRAWRFTIWLIVVISVRQSTIGNIWASLPGAGYGQFEHKADLIAKFKEAGGTVREIDVWAESPRLSPLWLSASSSAYHGLLIITVICITYKAQRDKNARELWSWRTPLITDMQMRQRDVAALDANTAGVSWC